MKMGSFSLRDDYMEKVRARSAREAGLGHVGGTSPWTDEVERSRMPEPRVTQEQLPRRLELAPAEAGDEGISIQAA